MNWTIEHVAETDSTQDDLLNRAEAGALVDRTARRADYQRRGRGRLDRTWEAPPGANLLVSLGFVEVPPDPGVVMRRVSVAIVDACRSLGLDEAALKWPNDVEVAGKKLAGVLAQRSSRGAVIVGVGLNVGWAPVGAVSLRSELGDGAVGPVDDVLTRLLCAYDRDGDRSNRSEWTGVEADYRRYLATIGQPVRVELPGETIEGIATGVDDVGQLVLVTSDGAEQTVSVGDVVHLRACHPDSR